MEEKKDNYQLQEENTIYKVILEENRIKKEKEKDNRKILSIFILVVFVTRLLFFKMISFYWYTISL